MVIGQIVDDINAEESDGTWAKLVAIVRAECAKADGRRLDHRGSIFTSTSESSFHLEWEKWRFVDVDRHGHTVYWQRFKAEDAAHLPDVSRGHLSIDEGALSLHGQAFQTIEEAALYLIALLR